MDACLVARSASHVAAGATTDGASPRIPTAALGGRADLHVHSLWSDGMQSPEEVVRAAAGRVDVLALTDHDTIHGARIAQEYAQDHPELGVDVIVGEEVSTLNGHVLALYIEEAIPPRLSAERTIELIHEQDGIAVAAHPFHPIRFRTSGHPALAALISDLPLDGVEVVNNSGPLARPYDAWAALRNADWQLAVTGSSDAHDIDYIGSALTRFRGRHAHTLRQALLERQTRAQLNWSWTMRRLARQWLLKCRGVVRDYIDPGRLATPAPGLLGVVSPPASPERAELVGPLSRLPSRTARGDDAHRPRRSMAHRRREP